MAAATGVREAARRDIGRLAHRGLGALRMSSEDWRRHFGPAYGRLAEAKRRHDPLNVLTPGYEVFEDLAGE